MDPHIYCALPKMETTTYLKKLLLMLYIPAIFNCRIFLIMAALFVSGLALSYSFVENAVSGVMILYVPLDWTKNNHLSEAAMIVGFQEGLSSIMAFVVAYLCDAYLGRFKTVVCSTFLYIMGLVILGVSTSLKRLETRLPVFFMAAVLISIGKAGREPPLRGFLADQIELQEQINLKEDKDNNRVEFKTTVWWGFACFLGAAASLVMSSLTSSATVSCRDSAFVMGVAYLVFLSGIRFYNRETPPTGIPLSPDTAIIVESSTPKEGKLSTINQLMLINMLYKMFPIWTTFLVYSLVQTTGSTFFFSRIQELNWDIIGHEVEVSLSALLIIKDFSSFVVSFTCELLISKPRMSEAKQKNAALIRIGAGMACSLMCCITAYLVEHFVNKTPDSDGTMALISFFWMTPQFILLGLMEGLAEDGLKDFLDYILATMDMYGLPFNDIVLSIGKFLSIPWILIFRSWIGDSRLDLYYLVLAIVNIPNLCLNLYFCSTLYAKEEDPGKEVELCRIPARVIVCDSVQVTNSHVSYP